MVAEATAPRRENVPWHILFHQLQGQKWRSESRRGAETSLQNLLSFTLTPTISTKSNPPIKTAVIILSAGLPDFA
jgi:hypothetical protein